MLCDVNEGRSGRSGNFGSNDKTFCDHCSMVTQWEVWLTTCNEHLVLQVRIT